jgi:RNA polymerase sigma-70 factor (ECF subfamily)
MVVVLGRLQEGDERGRGAKGGGGARVAWGRELPARRCVLTFATVRGSDQVSAALESLLSRFAAMVRSVGRRHRLEQSDVDELLQEVRIRLWRARGAGESIGAVPTSYIYRTAVTAALDLIRRRRARAGASLDEPTRAGERVAADTDSPERAVESAELAEQVARAIEAIPESRRGVVRMYLAGYPREEIAELLGWSEAKTRNLLYRGLADLRERLTAMGVGPDAGAKA